MHSYVLKSTFCLARSIGLPWKKVSVKCNPQSREIEKFGKGTQGKRKQHVRTSDRGTMKVWTFRSMQLGFTCDPQHVFALICSKLHASKSSQWTFLNTSIWFWYLFSFSLINLDKFLDFSALWVGILQKLSSMVSLSNERHKKRISLRTSDNWMQDVAKLHFV